jgi:3-hydroxybutyryl-CoA dehydrogenase
MTEVAVVGAGLMGHALALVFALGGHSVRLTDNDPETLSRAPALMETALETLREAGEVAASWTPQRLAEAVRCYPALDQTVAGAKLVIEAIIERPDTKRALYVQLEKLIEPDAILASNTSNLDIFPLVPPALGRRTIIAHWYTPPYLCDLVDLCPGPDTDPAAVTRVRDMVQAMGKAPVVFKQMVQGYVANRLQAAMQLEVYRLLDEGLVTPKDIDDSVIHGLALRIPILGIMAKADFTGLPLMQQGLRNRSYTPPEPRERNIGSVDRAGPDRRYGGKRILRLAGRSPEELFRDRDRKLLALKQALRGIGRMEGELNRIATRRSSSPPIHPPRPVAADTLHPPARPTARA